MPYTRSSKKKSETPDSTTAGYLIRQIDQIHQISSQYRDTFMGADFFREIREFYNMSVNMGQRYPTFRPRVDIPQLQMFTITEASDLADSNPKIYIVHNQEGKGNQRQKQHEKAFQALWRENFYNLQIMYGSLWSMLAGNGYVQVGFDRFANYGDGNVWLKARDPETVFPDPAATDDDDGFFQMFTDRLYPDVIRKMFPERGRQIREAPPSPIRDYGATTSMVPSLIMPPGPMSVTGFLPEEKLGISDGRLEVRTLIIKDPTVQDVVKAVAGSDTDIDKVIPAKFELKYPNGRMIVDCEGVILFDGDNPFPRKSFPLTRICGLPPLTSYYAPPPIRVSRNLQNTAERMFTQAYENAVRLNNGIWFIDEASGLSPEDFGGIPAEVRVIAANSKPPTQVMPKPFPPQFIEWPKLLLSLQKELQGFTDSRQGKQGAGNQSVDLFSEAVFHSQSLTRMRGKLLSESVFRIAESAFYLMTYMKGGNFADFSNEFDLVPWERIENADEWRLYLDPGSIQPISAMAQQKLALALKDKHMIDDRTALEWMNVPGADEIADRTEMERALEALSRLKKAK